MSSFPCISCCRCGLFWSLVSQNQGAAPVSTRDACVRRRVRMSGTLAVCTQPASCRYPGRARHPISPAEKHRSFLRFTDKPWLSLGWFGFSCEPSNEGRLGGPQSRGRTSQGNNCCEMMSWTAEPGRPAPTPLFSTPSGFTQLWICCHRLLMLLTPLSEKWISHSPLGWLHSWGYNSVKSDAREPAFTYSRVVPSPSESILLGHPPVVPTWSQREGMSYWCF